MVIDEKEGWTKYGESDFWLEEMLPPYIAAEGGNKGIRVRCRPGTISDEEAHGESAFQE